MTIARCLLLSGVAPRGGLSRPFPPRWGARARASRGDARGGACAAARRAAGPFGATIGGGPATLKAQVLQLGRGARPRPDVQPDERRAVLRADADGGAQDRGAPYACAPPLPTSLDAIEGEWELVLSSVPHGIFRSSPFFLAVQEAFNAGEGTSGPFEGVQDKSNLFFKLHELQTCSWGVSKIGRVAQRVDAASGYLFSEFDTTIFSLTVIPVLGWFKLLPTFGGCVITASKATAEADGKIKAMEVDYTTSRPCARPLGARQVDLVDQGARRRVWKLLPWNKGRAATCSVFLRYVDDDFGSCRTSTASGSSTHDPSRRSRSRTRSRSASISSAGTSRGCRRGAAFALFCALVLGSRPCCPEIFAWMRVSTPKIPECKCVIAF